MRSLVCNPTKSDCNHHKVMYVINPKEDTPAVMLYTLRVITCAYRRLHTNPSDWIKIKTSKEVLYFLAALLGPRPRTPFVISANSYSSISTQLLCSRLLRCPKKFSSWSDEFFRPLRLSASRCISHRERSGGN